MDSPVPFTSHLMTSISVGLLVETGRSRPNSQVCMALSVCVLDSGTERADNNNANDDGL